MEDKFSHVRRATQTRFHSCHWPGCGKQVPPAKWGCSGHWYMLPKSLRDEVWAAYIPGQEETMTPSQAYLEVAQRVQEWIKAHRPEGPLT